LINANSYKQGIRVKLPSSSSFINASIIDVGDASTDEDVALLKVNANNLPSLSINSQQPQANENLRIYGYPGNSTESQFYQTDSSVTPSTSTGNLQSEVTNSLNILYYETSAKVSEGFSGGPVLDNQNNILGIVIYSVATQNRLRQITNSQSSVFLSSKYLIQLCNKNHIPITLN
jgi:V8-like Glu-specific endopeptidase